MPDISFISAPAAKALLLPVKTIAPTSFLLSRPSQTYTNSLHKPEFKLIIFPNGTNSIKQTFPS